CLGPAQRILLVSAFLAVGLIRGDAVRADPMDAADVLRESPAGPQPTDPLPAAALVRLGTGRFSHAGHVESIAYAPDGKTIAAGSFDGSVRIWDAVTDAELHRIRDHKHLVFAVAFAPKGKLLASAGGSYSLSDEEGGDCAIRLWDPATGKEVRRLT